MKKNNVCCEGMSSEEAFNIGCFCSVFFLGAAVFACWVFFCDQTTVNSYYYDSVLASINSTMDNEVGVGDTALIPNSFYVVVKNPNGINDICGSWEFGTSCEIEEYLLSRGLEVRALDGYERVLVEYHTYPRDTPYLSSYECSDSEDLGVCPDGTIFFMGKLDSNALHD